MKTPKDFFQGAILPNAEHLFGEAPTATPDASTCIRNYSETLGDIAHMRQVHGDRIAYANKGGLYEEYDALITDKPDLWLCVQTADCVPILISSPKAVACVHAGWRGLAQEIIPLTIDVLINEFKAEAMDIHVNVGPHIRPNNYPVGEELLDYFDEGFFFEEEDDLHLDMCAVVENQVLDMNVPEENLWHTTRCTYADPKLNSYRLANKYKSNTKARNLSLIKFAP